MHASHIIRMAARYWSDNLIYWDGHNYRWTRSPRLKSDLPPNSKSGRIAVPFNACLKLVSPEKLHRISKQI